MTDDMKFTEEIILRYLDGDLNEIEIHQIKEEMNKNKELAKSIEAQRLIHTSLLGDPLKSPSAGFSQRVMKSIASSAVSEASFFNRGRLSVLILIALAVATTLYYFTVQFYPSIGGALSNEITMKNMTFDLEPAQKLLSSDLLFKIVLYVNGFISLLLLDRAVLKPYFTRRKQRYSM